MGLCLIPPFFFLSLSFSSSSLSLSLSLSLSSVAACCWVEPSCSLCFFVIPVALVCFCLPCSLCSIHSVIVCFSPLGLFCCCLDLFFCLRFISSLRFPSASKRQRSAAVPAPMRLLYSKKSMFSFAVLIVAVA